MNIQTKVLPPTNSTSKLVRARIENDPFTVLTMPFDHSVMDPEQQVAVRLALALELPAGDIVELPRARGYRTWLV